MSLEQYDRQKVIGRGSYGEVWLAKHKKDRKQFVLKRMDLRKASKRERKAAEQEAQLLSEMKHPNIVAYRESFEAEDGFLYIAMGFCEGGDLYSRLKEQKGVLLEERQVVEWFVQIAMALQYMHERNIMHRDLKTQNIFLTKSKVIKIGDLGIARILDSSTDMATTMIGTPYYMSPELFSNKPYNFKSDVWALGCCVYEMTTLKHAFNGKDMNSLMYKILRGRMPPMPSAYSPELVNLIHAMLNKTAEKRPTVNRILRDPYIKRNIQLFLDETRATSSSGRRPSTGNAKDRAASAPARKSTDSSSHNKSPTKAKKVSRPPAVVESLEPLHVGPDLEPIKEEPTPRESINAHDTPVYRSPVEIVNEPARRPVSWTPVAQSEALQPTPKKDESKRSVESARVKRRKQNRLIPITAAEAAKYSVRELPPYVPKPQINGRCDKPVAEVNRSNDSCGDSRNIVVEEARPSPSIAAILPASEARSAWHPGGDVASDNRIACTKIDAAEDSFSSPSQPKQIPSPRVLPPRPSSSRNPEVSRARPTSTRSNGGSAQASASSSSNSSATDDIAPSGGNISKLAGGAVSQSADIETPRTISARERRRKKKEMEIVTNSVELAPARSEYGKPVVSKSYQVESSSYRHDQNYSKPARLEAHNPVTQVKSAPGQLSELSAASKNSATAEPPEDNCSTGSSSEVEGQDKNGKKKSNDMKDFISLLVMTLQAKTPKPAVELKAEVDTAIPVPKRPLANLGKTFVKSASSIVRVPSIDEDEIPASVEEFEDFHPSIDQGFSVTTHGRLVERIFILRKDCIHRLGVAKLKRAYDIIDCCTSAEVEPHLIELLGHDDFDEFAGKIYQLKFYEETAFGSNVEIE